MKHGNGKSIIHRMIFPIATFDYHILNQSNSYRSRTTFSVDPRWFSWNQWLLALLGPILSFQHGNQKGLHPTGSKLRPKLGTAITRGWVVGRWWAIERSFHKFCGPTHDMSLVLVFRWLLKSRLAKWIPRAKVTLDPGGEVDHFGTGVQYRNVLWTVPVSINQPGKIDVQLEMGA